MVDYEVFLFVFLLNKYYINVWENIVVGVVVFFYISICNIVVGLIYGMLKWRLF